MTTPQHVAKARQHTLAREDKLWRGRLPAVAPRSYRIPLGRLPRT